MAIITSSASYVRMFLMVSAGDHITGITGLSPTVLLSKAGGGWGAAVGAVAEVGTGFYKVTLNSNDTGTFGDLAYHCTAANADPTDFTDQVVFYDTTNGKSLGLTYLDTNMLSRSGIITTAANFALLDIDTSGQIDISKVKGSVINSLISGRVDASANVTSWNGQSVQTPNINGVPLVDVKYWQGIVANSMIAGRIDVNASAIAVTAGTVSDKTGYSLSAGQLFVKKNTQLNNLSFVMSSNNQPKTNLTVSSLYAVDGGSFAVTSSSVIEMSSGWYKINLAAAELNGTVSALHFFSTGADDRNVTIVTQA